MSHFRLIENYTLKKVSVFFKQALQSWLQFQFHPPEKIEQILQQIQWLNSNDIAGVDKIPVVMGKMFENCILFLNYIVNWNGRVMSFMELSELYGKVSSIQEYNQLITVLPQKWRRFLAVGGGRELVSLPNIKDQDVDNCAIQIAK